MRVCIISEDTYPIVRGGLGEWAQSLIRTLSDIEFDVFCLTSSQNDKAVYPPLPNVRKYTYRAYSGIVEKRGRTLPASQEGVIGKILTSNLNGSPMDVQKFIELSTRYNLNKQWFYSKNYWSFLVDYYQKHLPNLNFVEFFWTIIGIQTTLFDTIKTPYDLPEADIYHSLTSGFGGLVAIIAKFLYHKPTIIMEHGLWLKERILALDRMDVSPWFRDQFRSYFESIIRSSFEHTDKVIFPCLAHSKYDIPLGLDMRKLRVINNGIITEDFPQAPPRDPEVPVIGCFARIVAVKGLDVLIQAAKIVNEKYPAEFVILGEVQDQEYYEQLKKLVQELDASKYIKFTGHVDALKWYHNVDVFTLTSHSEGVPYALLEGMCCGLPVVCTNVGGIPEIVTEETGFLVPPDNPEKLAEKYIQLITDKDLRRRMGQKGRERALAKYTLKRMVGEFREVYQELLAVSNSKSLAGSPVNPTKTPALVPEQIREKVPVS